MESIYISLLIIPCIIYYVTNKRNLEATRFTQASQNQLLNSWIVSEWSHHFTGNVSCHERTLAARLSSIRMWTACNDARSDSRRRRCTPLVRCSRRTGKERPSALGPIRRQPRYLRGAVPLNLHSQRTISHPPMQRSTSDPISARQKKRCARRETHCRITGKPHRTAAVVGVKGL